MCCALDSTDTCRGDGLCDSTWDNNIWRDFCTDPTWQAPDCLKICLVGSENQIEMGNVGSSAKITQYPDRSHCCGVGPNADACCSNKNGFRIARNGYATNVSSVAHQPYQTDRGSSAIAGQWMVSSSNKKATSITSSLIPASTNPSSIVAKDDSPSNSVDHPSTATLAVPARSSNISGTAGGGVAGGVAAGVLITILVTWFLRRRRHKPKVKKTTFCSLPERPNIVGAEGEVRSVDEMGGGDIRTFNEVQRSRAHRELDETTRNEICGSGTQRELEDTTRYEMSVQ
ncbi:MAG: hypothetical protein Q9222_006294 [Ikaeria aurantiellina]